MFQRYSQAVRPAYANAISVRRPRTGARTRGLNLCQIRWDGLGYNARVHETDPTRIPKLIARLQDAWEGQPDLTLPAFLGVLQNRGLSWGSTEDELLAILDEVAREHPSLLTAPLERTVCIATTAPQLTITLTSTTAIVRNAADPKRMPGVWRYDAFRPTGPGRPLVVRDTEGVEHRLGVVEMITGLPPKDADMLDGLRRVDVGSERWLLQCEDGSRVILGQRIWLWTVQGRQSLLETIAWDQLLACTPGAEIVVAPAGGGRPRKLGLLEEAYLLEA